MQIIRDVYYGRVSNLLLKLFIQIRKLSPQTGQLNFKLSNNVLVPRYFMMDLLKAYTSDSEGCHKYDTSLHIAGAPLQETSFSWKIAAALVFTWIVVYFCVYKGVKSSSYVVWVTVPGPVVFIFIMVLNGLCLPNADEGIRMYLRGEVDGEMPDLREKIEDG